MRTYTVEQNKGLSEKCAPYLVTGEVIGQIEGFAMKLVDQTVPFMDLNHQWRLVREDVHNSFENIFSKSEFCLGPYVENFEFQVSKFLDVRYALGELWNLRNSPRRQSAWPAPWG